MAEIKNLDFFKFNHFRKRDAEGNFEFGNPDNNYLDETNDEYLIGYKFEDDKAKEFKMLITDLLSNVEPSDPSDPSNPSDPTPTGKYVVDIAGPTISGTNDIYTVVYSDNSTKLITIAHGSSSSAGQPGGISGEGTGDPSADTPVNTGRSILNITGPVSEGLVDTYTIHYTDNTTSTFTVTNGRDGSGGEGGSSVQSDWNQSDSEAADFVKNRTHYVESFNCDPWLDVDVEEVGEELDGMFILNNYVPYPGCNVAKVTLTIDENEHVFFCQPTIDQEGSMTGMDLIGNDYSVEMVMMTGVAVIGIANDNGMVTGHVKIELYDYLYMTVNGESVAYPSNFAFGSISNNMDPVGAITTPLVLLENYNDGDIVTVRLNAGTNMETYTSSCKHIEIDNMPFISIGNPWVYLLLMMGGGEIQSVTDIPEGYRLMYGSMLGPDTGEDWCMISSSGTEQGTVFVKMNTAYQNENIQYFSVARSTVNVYKKLDSQYTQVDWNTDGNDNNSVIINKPCWKENKTPHLGSFNITCQRQSSGDYVYCFEGTTHFVFDDNFPVDFFYIKINDSAMFSCVVTWDAQFMSFTGRHDQGDTTGARLYGEYSIASNEITIYIEGNDLRDLNINSESQDCELQIDIEARLVLWDNNIAAEINNLNLQAPVNTGLTEVNVEEFGDGSYIHMIQIPNTYHTYMLIKDGIEVYITTSILNSGHLNLDRQTIKNLTLGEQHASYCGNLNWYLSNLMDVESVSIVDADDPNYSNAAFIFSSDAGTSQCMLVYKGAQDWQINQISIIPSFYVSYHKLDSRYLPDTSNSSSSSSFSGNYNDLSNKPNLATIATTGDYDDLTNKPVLFSGDYNDLANKPTIPTVPANVSAFTNDAGYLKTLVGDAVIPNAVSDYDGNTYSAVILGDQVWMAQNLRTTHYADGTYIGTQTHDESTPSYYTNPNVDLTTYGLLYPWDAVMNGASSSVTNPSGVQGIAPTGWHVPSDAEWTVLTDYINSQSEYQCDSNNEYIAKALSSTEGWNTSTNSCAVGNDLTTNNATGFSAVPAGYYHNSSFVDASRNASFFSSTQYDSSSARFRSLNHSIVYVSSGFNYKTIGMSVRCLYNGTVEEFLTQWLLANRNYYLRPKVNGFEFVLPPAFNVTAADAGKILMVDANGEYTPITLSELKTQLDALT